MISKSAQRRKDILNKILNPASTFMGASTEKFFNPEFKEVMESVRSADDEIWAIVKGEAGEDDANLKTLIKEARSNFNRREYIKAVNFLGRFHKKVDEIVKLIKQLNFKVDKVHHEFLFKDLDSEQEKHLESLKTRFAHPEYALKKEAGIMDFLASLTSTRGRALRAWESRYPDRVKNFKKDVGSLLGASEKMFHTIDDRLGEMGKAKTVRKVDDYTNAAKKIVGAYSKYDADFKTLYSANIKEFVNTFFAKKKEDAAKNEETSSEAAEELGDQEVPVSIPPRQETPTSPDLAPEIKDQDLNPVPSRFPEKGVDPNAAKVYEHLEDPESEVLKAPKTPDLGEIEEEDKGPPDTVRNPPTIPSPKAAHQKFVSFLETMGSEDPRFLTSYVRKYALQIQETDPEASIQLFQLANKIGS